MIDPKIQQQIDELTAIFKQQGNLGQLSPELLSYLTSQQGELDSNASGMHRGFATPDGRSFYQYGQLADLGGSPDSSSMSFDPNRAKWGGLDFMLNTDESNVAASFDPSGRFIGYEQRQDDKDWRDFITAAAMIAGGYYGGNYLAGAGEAGAGLSGMDLAADAALGTGNNIATAGAGLTGAGTTAGLSGMDLAADAGMNSVNSGGGTTWGGQAATAGTSAATKAGTTGTNAATTGANTASAGKGLLDIFKPDGTLDYAKLAAGLAGAYAGYEDSKDKQQTQSRDPWGPAQPYLKGLLSEGADLYGQYKQQPFSPTEQTAYSNLGNVYDFINANAGGLMSGFDATAAGKNQFSRNNPRRGLIGNSYDAATSPVAWQPGLLGSFGTRK